MAINLRVLKKYDKDIEKILCSARYCSLYEYERASKLWHACETSGPFFDVKSKNQHKMSIKIN